MTPRSLLLSLTLLIGLTGCPANRAFREGRDFDEAGSEFRAAGKYLDALEINENHKNAQAALLVVAESAYGEKLAQAESAERSRDFPAALKHYRGLRKFLDALDARGALTFTTGNVGAKVDEMENSAAEAQYLEGEEAVRQRFFDRAIGAYEAALAYKAPYKDASAKIGASYYGWAEDQLKGRLYREAALHFRNAAEHRVGAPPDAGVRSGAVYAALGRHFIGVDRCRQAVLDLREAEKSLGGAVVRPDLERAETCAVTPVAVSPSKTRRADRSPGWRSPRRWPTRSRARCGARAASS